MEVKRQRLDIRAYNYDGDLCLVNKIREFISSEIYQLENNVQKVLAIKDKVTVDNIKLKEDNIKLKEDNVLKTSELEECRRVIAEKEKEIESLYDQTMSEIKKWRGSIEETNEKQQELLTKKQIEIGRLNNENKNIQLENERQLVEIKKLKETVDLKDKYLEGKI